jgi:hypothetical protein
VEQDSSLSLEGLSGSHVIDACALADAHELGIGRSHAEDDGHSSLALPTMGSLMKVSEDPVEAVVCRHADGDLKGAVCKRKEGHELRQLITLSNR